MTRMKCTQKECMANFDKECFARCPLREEKRAMLDNIISHCEESRQRVTIDHGAGAFGALCGLTDYLKKMRREMS